MAWPASKWTELNIGPFYVDTDGDEGAARDALVQLEQVRWVLSGLLEDQNLTGIWPVRVLITRNYNTNPPAGFVSQNLAGLRGQHLLIAAPGAKLPLGEVAGVLLDENTPRLPEEVESGMRQLFDTLQAKGSRVTWGGAPPKPDLAWARMQLFATKFEYGASFHIFLSSLKSGGTLRAAASNAFGRPYAELEQEAAERLRAGHWEPVSVSGRPLDPRRDFGEHAMPSELAAAYLADAWIQTNPKQAEVAYRAAIEAGGPATAAGYEGLGQLAISRGEDPTEFLDGAIRANSRSAPVYLAVAKGRTPDEVERMCKRAALLNPRWGAPLYEQAKVTENLTEKEALLKKATQLDRRQPEYWMELAKVQIQNGHASVAQGSWLRAEEAAPTEAERARIHQLRMDAESARLDAAEAARQEEVQAAARADQRAQRAQAARIRAAEQKANQSLDKQSGTERPTAPMQWQQVVPEKKLDGTLLRVDCMGSNARLAVKDRTGKTISLLWRNTSELGLSCGDQKPAARVSLTYSADADEESKTEGAISSLKVWRSQ